MSAFGGLRREWDDERGSRWVQDAPDPVNHSAEFMKEETEHEIHRSAFVSDKEFAEDPEGAGADAVDERADNADLLDEHSQVTGWDGRPLGDDEIAHRNMYGDDPNTDRPIELATMEQAAGHIENLQAQLSAERGINADLLGGGMPGEIDRAWNAEVAAAHARLENSGMWDQADRQRMIDNHLSTQVNNQVQLGQAKYGEDFSAGLERLKQDAARSPQHLQYLKGIVFNGQLGDGVMQYHRANAPQQTRQQQQPPSRARSMQDEMDAAGGVSSADDERFIQDVWSD